VKAGEPERSTSPLRRRKVKTRSGLGKNANFFWPNTAHSLGGWEFPSECCYRNIINQLQADFGSGF
jgi:hypothetical protein